VFDDEEELRITSEGALWKREYRSLLSELARWE